MMIGTKFLHSWKRLTASYCKCLTAVAAAEVANLLLGLGGNHFFTQDQLGLDFFSTVILSTFFKNYILCLLV